MKFVNLPEDCGVNGVDDLLAAWGPARVLELFEAAVSGAELRVIASSAVPVETRRHVSHHGSGRNSFRKSN